MQVEVLELYFSAMERISAACAMDWSIELEKTLRSKTPGRAIEAILLTGLRLEQWSQESEANQTMCSMFGLLPREDRLFANTILLRLANAFVSGDLNIRQCIVKVFLSYTRHYRAKKMRKGDKGILTMGRVQNHVELLRKVKLVFDSGDIESRTLCLVLLGCWADFAKDSADIRYLILSNVVSSQILEAKASIFAAGCLCELAEDFAKVVLEMLINMVASAEISTDIRLAGAKVFAKMSCTSLVAERAYKAGMQLVLGASEENVINAMLLSLSKLASRSTILITEQVDMLFSCLDQEKSLQLQTIALRCLYFIFVREECCPRVTHYMVNALAVILDQPELPPSMQVGSIKILHKVLQCSLFYMSSFEIDECSKLFTVLEIASQSSVLPKSVYAFRILTDLATRQSRKTEIGSVGLFSLPSPSWIISLITERITSLWKSLFTSCPINPKTLPAVKWLLSHLVVLIRKHPESILLVVEKFGLFIDYLKKLDDGVSPDGQAPCETRDNSTHKHKSTSSQIYASIKQFFVASFQYIYEARPVTKEVHEKLEVLHERIQRFDPFDHSSIAMYIILMYCRILSGCRMDQNKSVGYLDCNLDVALPDILAECEILTLSHAEKMAREMDNWSVYRAGLYAATHGEWLVSAFMFGQLSTKAQSDSCSCWLRLLALFSDSEKSIRLLFLPNPQSNLVDCSAMEQYLLNHQKVLPAADVAMSSQKPDWSVVLLGAQRNLCSSMKIVDTLSLSGKSLCFQRWFLSLRAKVLGAAGEIFTILERFKQTDFCDSIQVDVTLSTHHDLAAKVIQLAWKVNRLAQEFDLLNGSFFDIDCQSSEVIEALALNCSVLAFTAGFPLFTLSILDHGTLAIDNLEGSKLRGLSDLLLLDLVARLSFVDSKTCANLCLLSNSIGCPKKCLHLQSQNRRLNWQCEIKDTLHIARCTVSSILNLHNKTNQMHDEELIFQSFNKGLQILFDTVTKWIKIPFRVPRYFFKVRPCFGSELYASGASSRDPNKVTSVLQGSLLSLNLCLQLKNAPPGFPFRHTKLYCLVHSRLPFQQNQTGGGYDESCRKCPPWERDETVEMNEKLLQRVMERTKGEQRRNEEQCDGPGEASAFVCFEVNGKGQGFANCLLDVSRFSPGCYEMKWYSSFVDKLGAYWTILSLTSGPQFVVE